MDFLEKESLEHIKKQPSIKLAYRVNGVFDLIVLVEGQDIKHLKETIMNFFQIEIESYPFFLLIF